MNVKYCVKGSIETTDSNLLDTIQSTLPSEQSPRVGAEYTETRQPVEDGSGERLSARMTFVSGLQGKARAEYLYEQVVGSDLASRADNWTLMLYRTPEGGVTPEEVREWYESHPDEQPTREASDGSEEPYVPNRWNPNNHIERQE